MITQLLVRLTSDGSEAGQVLQEDLPSAPGAAILVSLDAENRLVVWTLSADDPGIAGLQKTELVNRVLVDE